MHLAKLSTVSANERKKCLAKSEKSKPQQRQLQGRDKGWDKLQGRVSATVLKSELYTKNRKEVETQSTSSATVKGPVVKQ